MNTFWMSFNEKKNIDFDVQVVQRPNIPAPSRKVSYIKIPGRDGSLTETDNTYENITFSVKLNYLTPRSGHFMNQARAVKNWLTGSGKLKFSDDNEVFYKVKDVKIDNNIERILRRAGVFQALFTCDPFTYLESGASELSIEECKLNPYYVSMPIYHITGTGYCTLTVNDESSVINVTDNLIIDTDLMIMYTESGVIRNNSAQFPYENFRFQNGFNEISVSEGFDLKIQPNWRTL